jgi:tetratricopeptide (TPR) repeat protein
MHIRRQWLGRPLPHLVLAAIVAFALSSIPGDAQPAAPALSQSPSLPDLISLQEIRQEEFEPAIGEQIRSAYDQALHNTRDAEVVGRLGMILQCYGKYEPAEICYRRAWGLAPHTLRWVYYLGNIEAWLGRNQDAVRHIRESLTIEESYNPARVRLGQLLFESGDTQQSMTLFEESIRKNPRLAAAHLGLGRVLAASGNWPGAIASYRRSCGIFQNYAAAHYALGLAYRKNGDVAKAREQLELYELFKETPQPSEDPLMDEVKSLYAGGLTHFAKGSSLAREGKTTEAAAEFESALRVNPRLIMAHVNLIAMYGEQGQLDKAEQHFREASALDPGWAEAYYNWGLLLMRRQRTTEADEAFRKAITANPHYADAHVELGQLLDEAGRMTEAQQHFRLALEDAPANRQTHYLFGLSLIRTGQYSEAIAQLLETIKVEDEKTPICMQALAAAYQRAGDLKSAAHYTREARQRALSRNMTALAEQLQQDLVRLSKAP